MSAAIVALALGCHGDGGGGNPMPPQVRTLLCESDTPVVGDRIGFECQASSEQVLLVKVVIGGPGSSDIYGIKFDLLFNSSVLGFDSDAGLATFLAKDGGNTLVLAAVDESDPDRLVVAVSLQGAVSGVRVTDPVETVVGLLFRGLSPGTTTIQFENGEAVDSAGTPVGSVSFAGVLHVEVQ